MSVEASGAAAREERFESGAYARRGITLTRGEGARVWDDAGREYIDCVAGHGAAILGHGHPRLRAAIAEQAGRLISVPGAFASEVRAELLERLAAVTGLPRFFLCNSGTEAVEAALKIACRATGRAGVVAVRRGFHGRTCGALGATWQPSYRNDFLPLLPSAHWVPLGDVGAAREAIGRDTAVVVVEPIQGEGGVHPAPDGYLGELRRICDRAGALLVFDEVLTGFGRTGDWFAFQREAVTPDLLALAKGIAGGVPMGAVALGPALEPLPAGAHGSTFGGNLIACAAALAVLRELEERDLPRRAAELGEGALDTLRRRLAGCRSVREIRGRGLLLGVDLRFRVAPLLRRLAAEHGVLALPAGPTVLRLMPPLNIPEDDWRRVLDAVADVVLDTGKETGHGRR
jgi:acetylornithine/LysW-gamma-L-lysine aminotransferase